MTKKRTQAELAWAVETLGEARAKRAFREVFGDLARAGFSRAVCQRGGEEMVFEQAEACEGARDLLAWEKASAALTFTK